MFDNYNCSKYHHCSHIHLHIFTALCSRLQLYYVYSSLLKTFRSCRQKDEARLTGIFECYGNKIPELYLHVKTVLLESLEWSPVAYPGGFSGCPETAPPPSHTFFFNQGVRALLAPTFTIHLDFRLLETPLDSNSRYASVLHSHFYHL